MNHFHYSGTDLFCEEVSLAEIARTYGTPTYVYSHATLTRHFQVFSDAFSSIKHLVCYSVKANSNLAVLDLLFKLGAGADIVSGGELARVLAASGDPSKVVFSGVGKTTSEMRAALDVGILAFNVESIAELERLNQVASEADKIAPVSLRINPDVDAETHPYISTGLEENKFGIASQDALAAYGQAKLMRNISIVGIDCHIGSQLTKTSPFADAIERLASLIEELDSVGINISYFDIGGGLGIPYGDDPDNERIAPPSPAEYGEVVMSALAPLLSRGLTLICEPGRVIVGNAGILLSEVLYRKTSVAKEFVIVDAAFNDLLRPTLYNSFHPIRPVSQAPDRSMICADVVGPICETGDFLARARELRELLPGELLAIGAAGAYGFSMASNYNTRPRAAEVMVKGNRVELIRPREHLDDLFANERIPGAF